MNIIYISKKISAFIISASISIFPYYAFATEWGYEHQNGSEKWGELNNNFLLCKIGKNQTPIDLHQTIQASLHQINFSYPVSQGSVENKGYSIQFNLNDNVNNTIRKSNNEYRLSQIHFHTPSEHTIQNKYYPLEAHFVHFRENDDTTVVGVMFIEGEENPTLQKIINSAPLNVLYPPKNISEVDLMKLIPEEKSYFLYSGSLTTPPCSEGVRWIILKTPVQASKEQLNALTNMMGKNNRPIQDINTRFILE